MKKRRKNDSADFVNLFVVVMIIAMFGLAGGFGLKLIYHNQVNSLPSSQGTIVSTSFKEEYNEGTYYVIFVKAEYEVDGKTYLIDKSPDEAHTFSQISEVVQYLDDNYLRGEPIEVFYLQDSPKVSYYRKERVSWLAHLMVLALSVIALLAFLYYKKMLHDVRNIISLLVSREVDLSRLTQTDLLDVHKNTHFLDAALKKSKFDRSGFSVINMIRGRWNFFTEFLFIFILVPFNPIIIKYILKVEYIQHAVVFAGFPELYGIFNYLLLNSDLGIYIGIFSYLGYSFISVYFREIHTNENHNIFWSIIEAPFMALALMVIMPLGILVLMIIGFLIPVIIVLPTLFIVWISSLGSAIVQVNISYGHSFLFNLVLFGVLLYKITLKIPRLQRMKMVNKLDDHMEQTRQDAWIRKDGEVDQVVVNIGYLAFRYRDGTTYYGRIDANKFKKIGEYRHLNFIYDEILVITTSGGFKINKIDNNFVESIYQFDLERNNPKFFQQIDERIIIISRSYELYVLNRHTEKIQFITTLPHPVVSVFYDNKRLWIVHDNGLILSYHLMDDESYVDNKIEIPTQQINATCKVANRIYLGSEEGSLYVVNIDTMNIQNIPSSDIPVRSIQATNDYIFAGMLNGSVQIIAVHKNFSKTKEFTPHLYSIDVLELGQNVLYTGSIDGFVKSYHLNADLHLDRIELETESWMNLEDYAKIMKCMICKQNIEFGEDYLKCEHCKLPYHEEELMTWFQIGKSKCPVCRRILYSR